MDYHTVIRDIEYIQSVKPEKVTEQYGDEVYIDVKESDFAKMCFGLHQRLGSPVETFFAVDERPAAGAFILYCVFLDTENKKWFLVRTAVPSGNARFDSLAKEIYSASLFEREIKEMFGVMPAGNPDTRRLSLHDEVWPAGYYPLRSDFKPPRGLQLSLGKYEFKRIQGEGIFEVPVGPVHAGIIGPGHFRFSAAGEPIINLEIRLGFTHRGVEKLLAGRNAGEAVRFCECICGDAAFAYSLAFCHAVEKINGIVVPQEALFLRMVFLELERMYNHLTGIAGIALDVGYSFPAAFAAVIKENVLCLNEKLSASRYLKGINLVGGTAKGLDGQEKNLLLDALKSIESDFLELKQMLLSSVSFMDRVDTTGVLKKKTAEDIGVAGLAARASGIARDLRKIFPGAYGLVEFNMALRREGDVLARLNIRIEEFWESLKIIRQSLQKMQCRKDAMVKAAQCNGKAGFAMGYAEAWRGPLLFWVKLDDNGAISRCKVTDPSFRNWQGLSYAALGNIIPDFPVCNKSFDLSYPGNDL